MSKLLILLQLSNIWEIFSTLLVSKFEISICSKDIHSLNIPDIFSTFLVSKFFKSKLFNPLQELNIYDISLTLLVFKLPSFNSEIE